MVIINDLIERIKTYNSEETQVIKKAYDYAEYLHDGQFRQSGEPYITHPLEVAYILACMHADSNTICAALLHDTLEDTNTTKEELEQLFNKDIANLVDGVTKISRINFISKKEQNLANTRKIIRSFIDDVRIIIIKLADRLHNMRTLEFKSNEKQREISLETLEIFAPLAYYIGAYEIKKELEVLSFKYLEPSEYERIQNAVSKITLDSGNCLNEMMFDIDKLLNEEAIIHQISPRIKNVYEIHKKISDGYKIKDIHDLLSLKILVENIRNCYLALGVLHSKYKPINSKFKDYISNPKTNMYSSLHTTVFGKENNLVQTQIKTFKMDKVASYGIAACWEENKGDAKFIMQNTLKNNFQFFKPLSEIDYMYKDNEAFVSEIKSEIFSDKVYVYLLNGKIVELPKGANIIDLACYMDIDNNLLGARVNDKSVHIDYILKNKDRVNILIDNLSYENKSNWIEKANTEYVKTKIKRFG